MSRNTNKLMLVAVLVVSWSGGLAAGDILLPDTGALYGPNDDGNTPVGLDGGGAWLANEPSISWSVADNGDGTIRYCYTLDVSPQGDVSHFLLQLTDGTNDTTEFTIDDIASDSEGLRVWVDGERFSDISFDTWSSTGQGNSNPDMPAPFYGIKFDELEDFGTEVTICLDTPRLPMEGSFYAKDGVAGGLGQNAIWNTGLDPNFQGTAYFIPVPDSDEIVVVVPEPATLGLLLFGGVGLMGRRSRRQRVCG